MVLRLEQLVVGFAARTENQKPRTDDKKAGSQFSLLDSTVQLITCPNLEMQRGQRVALMGANGSGKTTLLRTIVGEHPALRGQVRLGHKVVINYYAQAHEGLQMHATVFDEIRRIKPLIKETEARTLLGRFLFSGDDVFKHVGDLSGGERSRVALAQLTLMAGNLLVLDEPTNHLDINAREALELVLNEYNGSILFVSHDRYFIDAVADTIWMVGEGTIKPFNGNYSEFTTWQEAAAREPAAPSAPRTASNGQPAPASRPAAAPAQPAAPADASKPIDRGAEREQRKRQRRLAALEGEIAMLEDEQKKLGEEMTAASIAGDGKRVKALENQYAELHDMLSSRYQEWSASAG
jgi:ATP-binding cassette subfamily F protein 3